LVFFPSKKKKFRTILLFSSEINLILYWKVYLTFLIISNVKFVKLKFNSKNSKTFRKNWGDFWEVSKRYKVIEYGIRPFNLL
jgi:hypothetical protein